MQCREISDLMMKYFDGNINEIELERLTKHNKGCRQCADEFDALKEAIFAVEDMPELEIPEGFETRIMGKIMDQKAYSINPHVLLFWLIGILGLLVFTANITAYYVVPYLRDCGIFLIVHNAAIYVLSNASAILRECLLAVTLLFGKLLALRDNIFKDYMIATNIIIVIFMCIDLLLVKALKLQDE